jgi:hypothetical protein
MDGNPDFQAGFDLLLVRCEPPLHSLLPDRTSALCTIRCAEL